MRKKTAFFCHFSLSLLVVGTVLAIVFLLWYPGFYFRVLGTMDVLKAFIGVNLARGPVLTLILYKPNLLVDIYMIAAIQLAALVYGVSVIYQERPYYAVFSVDRFEILAERDVDLSNVPDSERFEKPWGQPLVVFANLPTDPEARNRIIHETLLEGKPDIHRRPELWSSYDERADDVISRARPLARLRESRPDIADEITALMERYDNADQLVFVPIMGKKHVFSLVLDAQSKHPLEIIDADPWDIPAALARDSG